MGVARRYRWVFRKDRLEATKKGATAASKSLANVGWHQAWPDHLQQNLDQVCYKRRILTQEVVGVALRVANATLGATLSTPSATPATP